MKQVKAYKALDGKIFKKKEDAVKHEARLVLVEHFNKEGYFGPTGSGVGTEIAAFLDNNMDVISEYVGSSNTIKNLKSKIKTLEDINDKYEGYVEDAVERFNFWVCPKCDILAHPDYTCTACGYDRSKTE